ncbi:MAG: PAS domain-containing protein [Flavitalea sp.]
MSQTQPQDTPGLDNPVTGQHPQYELLMHLPVAVAVFRGPDYVIEMANTRMLEIWDLTTADVLNRPLYDVHPVLREQGFSELMDKVIREKTPLVIPEVPVTLMRKGVEHTIYIKLTYEPLPVNEHNVPAVMALAVEITDEVLIRKHLEEKSFAIEQSQAAFEKAFRESPMGMAILIGEDFLIRSANELMVEKFWRRKPEEVIGKSLVEAFPELLGQKYPMLLKQVMDSGIRHREQESLAIIKNGNREERFYLDFEYAPVTDLNGLVIGVRVTAYDVTDRVRVRQITEEAEEHSRVAIEATGLGTFDWNLQTQEFKYSKRTAEIFGVPEGQELHHSDLVNRIHPEDLAIRNEAVRNAYNTGSLNYRVRLIWPDNSVHWIDVYGKITYDTNHTPVKMYGTALDISLERNYQRSLEESELRFRSLADFLPTFIWTSDSLGKVTYVNKAILEYSGLSQSGVSSGDWFEMVHPDDRKNGVRRLEIAIASGRDFYSELRFRNKDGEYRWYLARTVALKDEHNIIQNWIGTAADIHDQKLMAEELERRVNARTTELKLANEELIRTNQELEQFAYVSSHDLQEPLRKIQTFSDMLLKKLPANEPEMKLHLEKINSSASRMSVLITDLLNYSRVSKSDENFEALNLNVVLSNILNDFEVLIKQKDAEVRGNGLPIIRGIPIQINQLFYNLISNALKFAVERPVITISAQEILGVEVPANVPLPREKNYVVLNFADNGIGFDQVYASQIFTIFQRLNNRNQYSGTGIGLAICKKIAENHGGYIMATSAVNKGATFTVYLSR